MVAMESVGRLGGSQGRSKGRRQWSEVDSRCSHRRKGATRYCSMDADETKSRRVDVDRTEDRFPGRIAQNLTAQRDLCELLVLCAALVQGLARLTVDSGIFRATTRSSTGVSKGNAKVKVLEPWYRGGREICTSCKLGVATLAS